MTHSMLRGSSASAHQTPSRLGSPNAFVADKSREYPTEGPDAYGALPEDLVPLGPPATTPTELRTTAYGPTESVAAAANE
jgi:hypothetical protein